MRTVHTHPFAHLLLLIPLSILPVSCGKKGPLVLPASHRPKPITAIQMRQDQGWVQLTVTLPQTVADGSPLDPQDVSQIRLYLTNGTVSRKHFARFARKEFTWQKSDLTPLPASKMLCRFPVPRESKPGSSFWVGLRYQTGHRWSPMAGPLSYTVPQPIDPIRDLKARRLFHLIHLDWSPPLTDARKGPLPHLDGYKVYRRPLNAPQEAEACMAEFPKGFVLKTPTPIPFPSYEDEQTNRDGQFLYAVTICSEGILEGPPSNGVVIQHTDTLPPPPPRDLVIFVASDHLYLNWQPAEGASGVLYRIYRRKGTERFEVVSESVRSTQYRDKDVQAGQTYTYRITALDARGNESQTSNTVTERFH